MIETIRAALVAAYLWLTEPVVGVTAEHFVPAIFIVGTFW